MRSRNFLYPLKSLDMIQSTLRHYSFLDRCLIQLDQGLRTIAFKTVPTRPNPAGHTQQSVLKEGDRQLGIALMRVNHAGEISAQALYHAQALMAHAPKVRDAMRQAGLEESDHLAWCGQRLEALNGRTSYLTPCWYWGSFAIGVCAGLAGDSWSLGFLAETERQVVNHLDEHLIQLPIQDVASRQILQQMRKDEAHHASTALIAGAKELPDFIKIIMRCFSHIMTKAAYWV